MPREELKGLILETVRGNALTEAYIKVVVSRGVSPEPLLDPRGCKPTLVIFARPYLSLFAGEAADRGIRVKVRGAGVHVFAVRGGQLVTPARSILVGIVPVTAELRCTRERRSDMGHELKVVDRGTVCRLQHRVFSYFAWPSVARADDGALLMVCSGLRTAHVDPFGKVVLYRSLDEGKTWGGPQVVIDTALDDRDAGIVNLGGGRLVVSSFNNTRETQRGFAARGAFGSKESIALGLAAVDNVTDDMEERFIGAHVIRSDDNGHTWGDLTLVPVSTPHGPSLRRDGTLLFAGTRFSEMGPTAGHPISVYTSRDGLAWEHLADVPACDDPRVAGCQYSEPSIRELKSGRIVLHIRLDRAGQTPEERVFTLCQSISDDGGKTFSVPRPLGNEGAPPHLLEHSSGALLCAYGRRKPPFGLSVMVSHDEAETWETELPLWREGLDRDLGYPCSVELPDGDLFTVYYAIVPGDGHKTSILWTRWRLG